MIVSALWLQHCLCQLSYSSLCPVSAEIDEHWWVYHLGM